MISLISDYLIPILANSLFGLMLVLIFKFTVDKWTLSKKGLKLNFFKKIIIEIVLMLLILFILSSYTVFSVFKCLLFMNIEILSEFFRCKGRFNITYKEVIILLTSGIVVLALNSIIRYKPGTRELKDKK